MFNGKTHYKWPCSIAMLVYQRVIPLICFIKSHIFPGGNHHFTTFLPQGTATGVGAEGLAAWAAVAGITSTCAGKDQNSGGWGHEPWVIDNYVLQIYIYIQYRYVYTYTPLFWYHVCIYIVYNHGYYISIIDICIYIHSIYPDQESGYITMMIHDVSTLWGTIGYIRIWTNQQLFQWQGVETQHRALNEEFWPQKSGINVIFRLIAVDRLHSLSSTPYSKPTIHQALFGSVSKP